MTGIEPLGPPARGSSHPTPAAPEPGGHLGPSPKTSGGCHRAVSFRCKNVRKSVYLLVIFIDVLACARDAGAEKHGHDEVEDSDDDEEIKHHVDQDQALRNSLRKMKEKIGGETHLRTYTSDTRAGEHRFGRSIHP